MVDFSEVIPFFAWGLIGLGIITFFYIVSKGVAYFRNLLASTRGKLTSEEITDPHTVEVEGIWYQLSRVIRFLQFIVVLSVVVIIVNYLISPSPSVNIYDAVFGQFTIPTVLLGLFYFIIRTIPWIVYNSNRMSGASGEDEL